MLGQLEHDRGSRVRALAQLQVAEDHPVSATVAARRAVDDHPAGNRRRR